MSNDFINESEIRKTIGLLKPNNELFEVRIIYSEKKNYSGYFTDAETLISELKKIPTYIKSTTKR